MSKSSIIIFLGYVHIHSLEGYIKVLFRISTSFLFCYLQRCIDAWSDAPLVYLVFLQKFAIKGAASSNWHVCGGGSFLLVNVRATFIS